MQERWLSEKEYQCAHSYVLRNCGYFDELESSFEHYISAKYTDLPEEEILAKRVEEYTDWIKEYVIAWKAEFPFPTWVLDIIHGPEMMVKTWPIYYTRGYLFHTQTHSEGRNTCNYGVCVSGVDYSNPDDRAEYHGIVTDILKLQYTGAVDLRITLFKCKWMDPVIGRGTRRSNGGLVDVLPKKRYPKYDPFILASQADQVCYIPYPYKGRKPKALWHNVVKVNLRANISGDYEHTEPTLLQQETDDNVILTTIEDLVVENSGPRVNPVTLDYEVGDAEQDDEFECNLSDSDDDLEGV